MNTGNKKPVLSYYYKFERGERLQVPGQYATFHSYSGLVYTNKITRDQLKGLDKLISEYLLKCEEENEISGAPVNGARFETSSGSDSTGGSPQTFPEAG